MAGLGRKVFTRQTLTSPEVQGYLMDQSVMRFASAAARSTAIPSPSEGMVTYLDDVDMLFVYRADVWSRVAEPGGWITIFEGAHNYSQAITTGTLTPLTSMATAGAGIVVPAGRQMEVEAYIPRVDVSAGGAVYLRIIANAVGKVAATVGAGAGSSNTQPVEMKCTVDGTGAAVGLSVAAYAGGAGGTVKGPEDGSAPGPRFRYKIT